MPRPDHHYVAAFSVLEVAFVSVLAAWINHPLAYLGAALIAVSAIVLTIKLRQLDRADAAIGDPSRAVTRYSISKIERCACCGKVQPEFGRDACHYCGVAFLWRWEV